MRYRWAIVKMSTKDWAIPRLFQDERDALVWLSRARDCGEEMAQYKLVSLETMIEK